MTTKITIEDLLTGLDKVKSTGNNQWQACCPAHEDNNPSLSISTGTDGRILLHCQAGCSIADICAALQINVSDLFADDKPQAKKQEYVASYKYTKDGVLQYTVHKTADKQYFTQLADGRWGYNGTARILYRLDELNKSTGIVYICEGEKDVDSVRTLGLTATTNPGGSNAWNKVDFTPLKGRDIVTLPDYDEIGKNGERPGEKWANTVETSLKKIAKSTKRIELPGLKESQDVTDWIEAGGTKAKLMGLVKAQAKQVNYKTLSKVQAKKVDWLWPEVIPKGFLTLLVSQEGIGKSTLAGFIAATISKGRAWPNSKEPNTAGDVIIFSHEETNAQVLVPRLEANGADLSRVHSASGIKANSVESDFDTELDCEALENMLDDLPDTKVIVFDPLTAYTTANENSNHKVRKALKPLTDLAAKRNIAILGLSHLNKKVDLKYINRTIGSRSWSAVPRMCWGIRKETIENDEGHKEETEVKLLLNIKASICQKPDGLQFTIAEGGKVVFHNDRISADMDDTKDEGGRYAGQAELVGKWLLERLDKGSVLQKTLAQEAQEYYSIGARRLNQISQGLPITKRNSQQQGGWVWSVKK